MKYRIKEIAQLMITKLTAEGYTLEESYAIIKEFLNNQISKSYKVYGIETFLRLLKYNKMKKKSPPQLNYIGNILHIDCGGHFIHSAWLNMKDTIIQNVNDNGSAIAIFSNNTTLVKASYPAKDLIANKISMISTLFINVNIVGYPNQRHALIGNQPISILAYPNSKNPFISDISLSKISTGKLKKFDKNLNGEEYGYKENGKPAEKISDIKSLKTIKGTNGFGFIAALEILTGGLLGAPLGRNKPEYTADNIYWMFLIDYKKFSTINTENNIKNFINYLNESLGDKWQQPGTSLKRDWTQYKYINLPTTTYKKLKD